MQNKKLLIISGCSVAAAIFVIFVAVFGFGSSGEAEPKPLDNALQIYLDAVAPLEEQENISYTVTEKKEVIIGSEVFNQLSEKSITFHNRNSNDFKGFATELLQIGEHQVSITETYTDGTGYFTLESSRFRSPMTSQDFISRFVPAVPIDPSLYASVTGYHDNGETVIEFIRADKVESWLNTDSATFVSSDATVRLSKDGTLTQTVYRVSYTVNETFIRKTVTVTPTEDADGPIETPEGHFTLIDVPDAPRMLEIATGYLLDPASITAIYEDKIHCQAFGDLRKQSITIHAVNTDTWRSLTDTQITMENTGNLGAISTLTRKELYSGGILKTTVNGESQNTEEQEEETVKTKCQDTFVGTILLPQYITAVTVTEELDAYRYEYTGNDTLSSLLSAEACATVYQNTEILREHAQEYSTDTCTGYLTVSKTTGLPLSSGFTYIGIYTIDAVPYELEFSAHQEYDLLNDSANKTILNEAS